MTFWRGYGEVINIVDSAAVLNVFYMVNLVASILAVAFCFWNERRITLG